MFEQHNRLPDAEVQPNGSTSPLQGKRVLVTRTRNQAGVLSEQLRARGAIPVEFPTITIVPPRDWSQLDAALQRLFTPARPGEALEAGGVEYTEQKSSYYDWLVFTSANGVNICFERLQSLGYDPRALSERNVRVATIGPATAAALARYGVRADLVPDEYIAESVAAALIQDAQQRGTSLQGIHFLLARAAEARKMLVARLRQAGAEVDEVAAYYTHPVAKDDEHGQAVLRQLRQGQIAILTFTSSSTVRNFVSWLRSCAQDEDAFKSLVAHPLIACIGPITSQTARELGLHVAIEAKEFTIGGLIKAIELLRDN